MGNFNGAINGILMGVYAVVHVANHEEDWVSWPSKYRSQIIVVYVHANGFLLSPPCVSQYCKRYQTRKWL